MTMGYTGTTAVRAQGSGSATVLRLYIYVIPRMFHIYVGHIIRVVGSLLVARVVQYK